MNILSIIIALLLFNEIQIYLYLKLKYKSYHLKLPYYLIRSVCNNNFVQNSGLFAIMLIG